MRSRFLVLYLSLVGLGAIVAHLASEYAGMGSAAAAVTISSRHLYLALGAGVLSGLAVRALVTTWRASSNGRDLKRLLQLGVETLPFRGRGVRFYGLTALVQLSVGLATEIGEGCPLCGHDIAFGVAGAGLTVLVLALAAWAVGTRLPRIAAAIARIALVLHANATHARISPVDAPAVLASLIRAARRFCRPPPQPQA